MNEPQPPVTQESLTAAQQGIVCAVCHCRNLLCWSTEPLRDGTVRRRKRCRNCGWDTVTLERPRDR